MATKRKHSDAPTEARKSKKVKSGSSKREREEPSALPEPLEGPDDTTDTPETNPKKEKKDKKDKKEKKNKKDKTKKDNSPNKDEDSESKTKTKTVPASDDNEQKQTETATDGADAAIKSKKNKKAKKETAEGADAEDAPAEGAKSKAPRFIVFVGNLPYSATAATIRQHFESVKPNSVRCLQKDGKENSCRGFAFIEFTNPTNMRTCLDKMHHSTFDDGISPARKINVELTAGGGGSKTNRKDKIKARNAQLEVNRAKRIQKEQAAKKGKGPTEPDAQDNIHPSRRAMMA